MIEEFFGHTEERRGAPSFLKNLRCLVAKDDTNASLITANSIFSTTYITVLKIDGRERY